MVEFFTEIFDTLVNFISQLINLPYELLYQATESLNSIEFDQTLLFNYLGYMRFAMGDTLYFMFSTVALIFIGASLWSFTLKGINFIKELLPMQ